ncbi:hypothetical protein EGW35_00350 [Enterococcus durans]|nr:hypothetical protein EGW35_00350 [Enterococcus durans]
MVKHRSINESDERGRDKSRLVLRNWREKRTIRFCIARFFFFEISEKPNFWTPFIRESVAKLIFRFVPHPFL